VRNQLTEEQQKKKERKSDGSDQPLVSKSTCEQANMNTRQVQRNASTLEPIWESLVATLKSRLFFFFANSIKPACKFLHVTCPVNLDNPPKSQENRPVSSRDRGRDFGL